MTSDKPRIKLIKPWLFGIEWPAEFVCTSRDACGYGRTAQIAYESWEEDRPKSPARRLMRRLSNWLADVFL